MRRFHEHTRVWWMSSAALGAALILTGCGDDPPTIPSTDSGLPRDAGRDAGAARDAGPFITDRDAGPRDAGSPPTGPVVINEIMYHPADTAGRAEFVEIHNASDEPKDVGGWQLRGFGLVFPPTTIPARSFVVVAEDQAGFTAAYQSTADFVTNGGLKNGGEVLELIDGAGTIVDRVEYSDVPPWPVTADGEGPALELVSPTLDNADARAWRAGGPTPGRENSVYQVEPPPYVVSVVFPKDPDPNAALTITAMIDGATSADLDVRIDFEDPTTTTMTAAGNGTFTADIPGQAAGALVRFGITGRGPSGEATWPREDDSVRWDGTVVRDPSVSTALPVFQWFMHPDDYMDARFGWFKDDLYPAVFYVDGELFDGVRVRIKGDSSRQFTKNHWKFKLPRGHLLVLDGVTPAPVDQFNLQSSYADKSYLRDVLSYRTWAEAGMPTNAAASVRLHQNGAFFGLYTFVEDMDRDYLERHGFDTDGAWYEAGADATPMGLGEIEDFYEKNTRTGESYDDLVQFLLAMDDTSQARHNYILDNVDLPTMINYLAVNIVLHNNDQVAKNYYLYRDTLGTGRWRIMPWDMDLTFGRNSDPFVLSDNILADDDAPRMEAPQVSPSHPRFGDRDHQKWDERANNLTHAMHEDADFRAMFYRRLRSVMDQFLTAGVYEQWITDHVLLIGPEATLDASSWKQYGTPMDHATAVSQIVDDYLPRRRTHLFTTHRVAGEIPTAQSTAPSIVINELHFAPTEGTSAEFVELYNPSTTEAVDLTGWQIIGAELTIPAGTVILPGRYAVLVKNDAAFRTARGGGRFVPTFYPGELDNNGESIELRDRDGRVVDRVAYSATAPWPTGASSGASLELIEVALDHTAPTSWAASTIPGGTPGARNTASP